MKKLIEAFISFEFEFELKEAHLNKKQVVLVGQRAEYSK